MYFQIYQCSIYKTETCVLQFQCPKIKKKNGIVIGIQSGTVRLI